VTNEVSETLIEDFIIQILLKPLHFVSCSGCLSLISYLMAETEANSCISLDWWTSPN